MLTMVRCNACGYHIPVAVFATAREGACPLCRRPVSAVLLPAMNQTPGAGPPVLPEDPPGPGEPACFYNPERRATRTCFHCGVYVSESWSAQWGSGHVCLKCLDDLRNRRKDERFEVRRVLWDNIALGVALLPFLMCVALLLLGPVGMFLMIFCVMASAVTAPVGLGLAIYAWKKPRSLVPRGPARVILALVLSLLQCGAWAFLIIAGMTNAYF